MDGKHSLPPSPPFAVDSVELKLVSGNYSQKRSPMAPPFVRACCVDNEQSASGESPPGRRGSARKFSLVDPADLRAEGRTLEHWKALLGNEEFAIECSQIQLNGRDHEGEIFCGPGRIKFARNGKIEFWIYASPADGGTAFRKLRESEAAPYDEQSQIRLTTKEFNGSDFGG